MKKELKIKLLQEDIHTLRDVVRNLKRYIIIPKCSILKIFFNIKEIWLRYTVYDHTKISSTSVYTPFVQKRIRKLRSKWLKIMQEDIEKVIKEMESNLKNSR